MELSNKRKRSENWDSTDKILLLHLIEEKILIVEDKSVDTNTTKAKREAWKEILCSFNNCAITKRDVTQIQRQWRKKKIDAKMRLSAYKKQRGATGGGPPPKSPDPMDTRLMALIPDEFALDHNDDDCDAPDNALEIENEEYLDEELVDAFLLTDDIPTTTTILKDSSNTTYPKSTSRQKKSPKPKVDEDQLKVDFLEAAIQAKNKESILLKDRMGEEIETLRIERAYKIKAFEEDERRKEEEHQMKMKELELKLRCIEEEHQLKLQLMTQNHS